MSGIFKYFLCPNENKTIREFGLNLSIYKKTHCPERLPIYIYNIISMCNL